MKVQRQEKAAGSEALTQAQLGTLEQELGISLRDPRVPRRMPNQQFGVHDEDGVFAGDICAAHQYFEEDELRERITALFPPEENVKSKRGKHARK